ncbi:MAG TPA: universal stress protein [Bryobacteraceae bacterium]|nr:universal stress protein [Bryobacteraceae bacterium]
MLSLSKLVVPVDFSERSAGAARYARVLASHFRSELHLLHVVTPLEVEMGAIAGGETMLDELYRTRTHQKAQELDTFLAGELGGLAVRRILLEGDSARKIVEYAHDQRADLVVMATHGYGPFRRFILGSNTAKVLHDADCPVWTGIHLERAPVETPMPFRKLLCAVDLGPQSRHALGWAAGLQKEFGAHLTLVHATMPIPDQGEGVPLQWDATIRAAAEDALRKMTQEVEVEADTVVQPGDPAEVLCAAATRLHAELLVIGRGSAAGVFGRLRTNAYAIIRQSPCPVVSV